MRHKYLLTAWIILAFFVQSIIPGKYSLKNNDPAHYRRQSTGQINERFSSSLSSKFMAPLYAQESEKNISGSGQIKPAGDDGQKNKNDITKKSLQHVMWVILVIWAGLAAYLFSIDRKISMLRKKIDEQ